jgi:hypothetical protein
MPGGEEKRGNRRMTTTAGEPAPERNEEKTMTKNNIIIAAMTAASALAMAAPASAQTATGTVNITGSVASKCVVLPGSGSTFGTTVALGELAQADGTMRNNLAATFNAAAGLTARVLCNTAAPTISVDAEEITAATAATAGYTNRIDYTASVAVTTTGVSPAPFTNDSAVGPLAATLIGGGRLANNGGSNIAITANNFRTVSGATDLLVADPTYTGKITVVIAPGA